MSGAIAAKFNVVSRCFKRRLSQCLDLLGWACSGIPRVCRDVKLEYAHKCNVACASSWNTANGTVRMPLKL